MGYNTTIFIPNDQWHDIKRDPERLMQDIDRHMMDGTDHAIGQTTIMPTAHADVPRLYFTQGNSIIELSEWSDRTLGYARSPHETHREYVRSCVKKAEGMLRDLKKVLKKIEEEG